MIRIDDLHPTVFLIDFGLARLFRNPATYLHFPFTTDHSIVGTLPFVSINGQQGYAQSRRDDLESLAYTIIYSALGNLPWTSNAVGNEEAILQKKTSITAEELCEGLPAPFCKFVTCVRSLGFDQKPDYQYLHSILLQCSEAEANQPIKAPPLYLCPQVSVESVDPEPIFTSPV
jgi:serine/threonine protein kinase